MLIVRARNEQISQSSTSEISSLLEELDIEILQCTDLMLVSVNFIFMFVCFFFIFREISDLEDSKKKALQQMSEEYETKLREKYDYITAVSYTHLDVYKRQVYDL